MNLKLEDLTKLVLMSLKDFANQNGYDLMQEIDLNTRLIGNNALFDSIDLVSYIVELEEALDLKYNIKIDIANDRAMSQRTSPFINALELSKYIIQYQND